MCTTCGCGSNEAKVEGQTVYRHARERPVASSWANAHRHAHQGGHAHGGRNAGVHDHGHESGKYRGGHFHADGTWHADHPAAEESEGALGAAHAPGMSAARILQVERDILAKNDALALANRQRLAERGVFALNLVSSPGSGKTTLLCRTISAWGDLSAVSVIEGDQQTSFDADRIRATGARAVQVNTGKGCHLDANMVGRALDELAPADDSLLFIENVGNLVCPAAFDLGEAHKVVILSVTEGEDKPLKYPDMFRAADLLLVNKLDLLPYVQFDVGKAVAYAQRVRPGLPAIELSATTGTGFELWLEWLRAGCAHARERRSGATNGPWRRAAEPETRVVSLGGAA